MFGDQRGYCIQEHEADTICTSPTCPFPSLQCSVDNCKCSTCHEECFTYNLKLKPLLNRLLKKSDDLKKPYKQAVQWCDDIIKMVLVYQKEYQKMAQGHVVMGEEEQRFISKINFEESRKIKGEEVARVVELLKQGVDTKDCEESMRRAFSTGKEMVESIFYQLQTSITMASKMVSTKKRITIIKQAPKQTLPLNVPIQTPKQPPIQTPYQPVDYNDRFLRKPKSPSQTSQRTTLIKTQSSSNPPPKPNERNTQKTIIKAQSQPPKPNNKKLSAQEFRSQLQKYSISKIYFSNNTSTSSKGKNYESKTVTGLNIKQIDQQLIEILHDNCPKFQKLRMGQNGKCFFDDQCAKILVEKLPNLTELKILNSLLTDKGAVVIAQNMKRLTTLSLKSNKSITNECKVLVRKMLPFVADIFE